MMNRVNLVSVFEALTESEAQSPPKEDKVDTEEKCHICKLKKKENSIKCSTCFQLFHRICLFMNLRDFTTAYREKNWNCANCLSDLDIAKCPSCLNRPLYSGNSKCMDCFFPTAQMDSDNESSSRLDKIPAPFEMLPKIFTDSLPPQVHPTVDTIMSVFVTHANNPWDFYVIPKYTDWKMKLPQDNNCWKEFNSLVAAMTQFYQTVEPQESDNWEANQLVAVRSTPLAQWIPSNDFGAADSKEERDDGWYRAVVVVNQDSEEESTENYGQIRLYLFDIGLVLLPITGNVFRLSPMFLNTAPLAHKCRLFGVSPVYTNWTEEACVKFCKWTKGEGIVNVRAVNIEHQKEIYHGMFSLDSDILPANEQYYNVELRISKNESHVPTSVDSDSDSDIAFAPNNASSGDLPSQKDTSDGEIVFESIAKKLAKDGIGLQWNSFPERPQICRTVKESADVLSDLPFQPSEELESVKKTERERLESYLRVTPVEEETEEQVLCLCVKNDPRLVKGTKDVDEFSHRVLSQMRNENKKKEEPQEVENPNC